MHYITDEIQAEAAIRAIKEARAYRDDRLRRNAENKSFYVDFYDNEAERIKSECDYETQSKLAALQLYLEQSSAKPTKTQKAMRLPSGKLVLKFGGAKLSKDDKTLLDYLQSSGQTEYIRIKQEPAWDKYKPTLTIVDGQVVDADGEIVSGVNVTYEPDRFEVQI